MRFKAKIVYNEALYPSLLVTITPIGTYRLHTTSSLGTVLPPHPHTLFYFLLTDLFSIKCLYYFICFSFIELVHVHIYTIIQNCKQQHVCSAVLAHRHAGQLPGGPTIIGVPANLCICVQRAF